MLFGVYREVCVKQIMMAVLVSVGLWAQTTTGTVTGTVTDSAGALVGAAAVKLVNTGTGLALSTQTGDNGSYVFPLVQPGTYEISIEKQGFQKFARSFPLAVTQQARIDAQLAVGQVSESVQVSAAAVVLETDTSNLGQVISNRQVVDLPLNGTRHYPAAGRTPPGSPPVRGRAGRHGCSGGDGRSPRRMG